MYGLPIFKCIWISWLCVRCPNVVAGMLINCVCVCSGVCSWCSWLILMQHKIKLLISSCSWFLIRVQSMLGLKYLAYGKYLVSFRCCCDIFIVIPNYLIHWRSCGSNQSFYGLSDSHFISMNTLWHLAYPCLLLW